MAQDTTGTTRCIDRRGIKVEDVHCEQVETADDGYARMAPKARESGLPSLVNVWVDPDIYAAGTPVSYTHLTLPTNREV